jgi:subfamily B ATP-binding cassette protein HlyB/CyaB
LCGIAAYYRIGADPVGLQRQLALGAREADELDLIRAAQQIGLRARLITGASAQRMGKMPTPAIVRLKDGRFTCSPVAFRHAFAGWSSRSAMR